MPVDDIAPDVTNLMRQLEDQQSTCPSLKRFPFQGVKAYGMELPKKNRHAPGHNTRDRMNGSCPSRAQNGWNFACSGTGALAQERWR